MSEKPPTPDSISNNYAAEHMTEGGLIVAESSANHSYSRDGTAATSKQPEPGTDLVVFDPQGGNGGWEMVDGELVDEQDMGAADNFSSSQRAPFVDLSAMDNFSGSQGNPLVHDREEVPQTSEERLIGPPMAPEQDAGEEDRSLFNNPRRINPKEVGGKVGYMNVGRDERGRLISIYLNEGTSVRYNDTDSYGRQRIGKEYEKEGDRLTWSVHKASRLPRFLMHAADGTTYYARGGKLYNLDEIRRTGKRTGQAIIDPKGNATLEDTIIGMTQILPDGQETAPINKVEVELGSLIDTGKDSPLRDEDPFETAEKLLRQYPYEPDTVEIPVVPSNDGNTEVMEVQDPSPEGIRARARQIMGTAAHNLRDLHTLAKSKASKGLTKAQTKTQEVMIRALDYYNSDEAREKRRKIASGVIGAVALGGRGVVYLGLKAGSKANQGRVKVQAKAQENLKRAADYYNSDEAREKRRKIAANALGAIALSGQGLGIFPEIDIRPTLTKIAELEDEDQ